MGLVKKLMNLTGRIGSAQAGSGLHYLTRLDPIRPDLPPRVLTPPVNSLVIVTCDPLGAIRATVEVDMFF